MDATEVAKIRVKMARIRSRAQTKAVRLGEETKRFLDWKHYVRLFPWGVVGTAALIGFLLVPARRRPVNDSIPASPVPTPSPVAASKASPPSLMSSIGSAVTKAAMRMAITYAGQAVGQYLAALRPHATDDFSEEHSRDHVYHSSY